MEHEEWLEFHICEWCGDSMDTCNCPKIGERYLANSGSLWEVLHVDAVKVSVIRKAIRAGGQWYAPKNETPYPWLWCALQGPAMQRIDSIAQLPEFAR